MAVSRTFCSRVLTTCATLLAVVTLMIATCVVPVVARNPLLAGPTDQAVPAFWVLATVAGVVTVLLYALALTARVRSFLVTGLLALASLATLLLALFLHDAGMAYWTQGPVMRGVALASFTGAGTCLLVATTVLSTAFLLPGRTPPTTRSG